MKIKPKPAGAVLDSAGKLNTKDEDSVFDSEEFIPATSEFLNNLDDALNQLQNAIGEHADCIAGICVLSDDGKDAKKAGHPADQALMSQVNNKIWIQINRVNHLTYLISTLTNSVQL